MMKTIRRTVLFFVCMLCAVHAEAVPVTQGQAEQAAHGYLSRNERPLGAKVGRQARHVRTFNREGTDTPLFHVVALEDGGFVVTSADTKVSPIIAISEDEDLIEDEKNHLWVLLNRDLPQRMDTVSSTMTLLAGDEMSAEEEQWASLLGGGQISIMAAGVDPISDVRVAPLVETKWNQATFNNAGYPGNSSTWCYNYYTPGNWYCGCVATAGAQIMRYHRHPASAAAKTYACWVSNVASNLTMMGGTYAWADMPTSVTSSGSGTEIQRQAIGHLMYDVGVASQMNYGQGGSGAHNCVMVVGLTNAFGYASGLTLLISGGTSWPINNADIRNALLASLDAGLPTVLGMRSVDNYGHSIVADGYGYDSGTLYAHLNMGWGGVQDAWYNMEPFAVSSNPEYTLFSDVSYNISPTWKGEWITGRTLDNMGAPVSGSTVVARNTGSGETFTAMSNAKGIYAILVPPPSGTASYALSATNGSLTVSEGTPVSVAASATCRYGTLTPSTISWSFAGTVGNRWGNDLAFGGTVPSLPAPANVFATTTLTDKIQITWSSVPNATGYKIFRDNTGNQIGTSVSVSYDDFTAAAGMAYTYWVKATDGSGDSALSASAQGLRVIPVTHDLRFYKHSTWPASCYVTTNNDSLASIAVFTLGSTVYLRYLFEDYYNNAITTAWTDRISISGADSRSTTVTNDKLDVGALPGWEITFSSLPAGLYTATVELNYNRAITETDYNNNTATLNFAVIKDAPAIPLSWFATYFPGNTGFYTLATSTGANGVPVWHAYVAGLNPTNKASQFRITGMTFTNAVPYFTWDPDLRPTRAYALEGKTNLTDSGWVSPTNSSHRFFRVNVNMAQ